MRSLAVGALLAAVACRGDPAAESARCTSTRDCLGWESCSPAGRCGAARTCETAADCVAGDACSPNGWCSAPPLLDPDEVAVAGWIKVGLQGAAIAPIAAPTQLIVAYPQVGTVVHQLGILPGGEILYLASDVDTSGPSPVAVVHLRRLEQDAWPAGDDGWVVPEHGTENDSIVPTPACVASQFVLRHGSGELLHNCEYGTDWYDLEGNLRASGVRVHGWRGDGAMLVAAPEEYRLAVRTASGQHQPATGGPFAAAYLTSRAHGDGFWVLASNLGTGRAERWFIAQDGSGTAVAVLEGAYPPRTCPSPYHACIEQALDASGATYRLVWELIDGSLVAMAERCRVDSPQCERLLDPRVHEVPPVEDALASPPRWFARAGLGLPMITGP